MTSPGPAPIDDFRALMDRLRQGDDAAAATVFQEFVSRLIRLSRSQLDTWVRGKVDPEDVVQSVYRSFFVRYRAGQFTVADWDSLWGLLAVITVRKCANQAEHWQAARRAARQEVPAGPGRSAIRRNAPAPDPTPEESAAFAETLEQLFQGLSDREREILALHLQGCDVPEISRRIGRAERTVRRTLDLARADLCRLLAADEPTS